LTDIANDEGGRDRCEGWARHMDGILC
jgi:hypothetical protein